VSCTELGHLGIFVVDIVVRLFLADERMRYLVRHWYDVLVLALPLLRPLRLLRLIPLLSVLNRRATMRLRGRVGIYVAGGASLLAFCAALAVLDAERSSPDANISDFGDAIWWAVTTMTTVGYAGWVRPARPPPSRPCSNPFRQLRFASAEAMAALREVAGA
jgi:voltage-gated potassium channel Kch